MTLPGRHGSSTVTACLSKGWKSDLRILMRLKGVKTANVPVKTGAAVKKPQGGCADLSSGGRSHAEAIITTNTTVCWLFVQWVGLNSTNGWSSKDGPWLLAVIAPRSELQNEPEKASGRASSSAHEHGAPSKGDKETAAISKCKFAKDNVLASYSR